MKSPLNVMPKNRPTAVTIALAVLVSVLVSALVSVAGPVGPVDAFENDTFTAISPLRVLDTRNGLGAPGEPLGPTTTITLDLSDVEDVPFDATGVVLNVTTTQSSAPSFITVWPTGQQRPGTSNLNTEPGQDTPNLVVARLGTDRSVDIYNDAGSVHVIADVTSWIRGVRSIDSVPPSRLLDSRSGVRTADSPFGAGETRQVQITGQGGVPGDAAAAVLNVTSTNSSGPSFLTVWPSGEPRPLASTLNTEPGQNTPNLAVVRIGVGGAVDIYNDTGSTDVILDVVGFVAADSYIETGSPERLLDTRVGTGVDGRRTPVGPDDVIDLRVAGVGDVPTNATAVIVNITSVASTEPSFVTVWPTGAERPTASTLNTEVGQATPNLAVVKVGDFGEISLFNKFGSTHLLADVTGWYLPSTSRPIVEDLDFFLGSGFRSTTDFGVTRSSSWRWNGDTGVLEASTAAGFPAIGENFYSYARLHTPFQARRVDADLSYDIEWSGTMTSFVGADAAAEVEITIRVYEVILNPGGPVGRGTVIWERELESSGVGAGLQAISVDQVVDDVQRTERLPELVIGRSYRVEAEVRCSTRVIFSVGATACDFHTGDRGVTVNDWGLEYGPTS